MRRLEVEIQAGVLALALREEIWPLEDLLAFATRENPKRAFLFVSKVLGRHWPCRPSVMRRAYRELAASLAKAPGPLMVFGMAETATALGHGVYDSLLRQNPGQTAVYQHTTRHLVDWPVAFQIEESHSHAVEHTVYQPLPECREVFAEARTLVLVDDEISTGKTLVALAKAYLALNPQIEQVQLLALVSWLTPERLAEMSRELERPVHLRALASGSFGFLPRVGFRPTLSPRPAAASRPGRQVARGFGRLGCQGLGRAPKLGDDLQPGSRLVVVGTGEFAFAPFLLAESLEEAGHDVLFQSTTRSPILLGDAIRTKLVFSDHHDEGITNYLYNFPGEDRRVILAYEHPELGERHDLVKAFPQQTGHDTLQCWSPTLVTDPVGP